MAEGLDGEGVGVFFNPKHCKQTLEPPSSSRLGIMVLYGEHLLQTKAPQDLKFPNKQKREEKKKDKEVKTLTARD